MCEGERKVCMKGEKGVCKRKEGACVRREGGGGGGGGGVGEGVRVLKYASQLNWTHKEVIIAAVE